MNEWLWEAARLLWVVSAEFGIAYLMLGLVVFVGFVLLGVRARFK